MGPSDVRRSLPVPTPFDVEHPAGAMRIAITGGSGFVGGHLAEALSAGGHEAIVLARGVDRRPWAQKVLGMPGVSFVQVGIGDERGLVKAFEGCDAVAHCAGINREIGSQTYEAVHIGGTLNVVRAAEEAGYATWRLSASCALVPAAGPRITSRSGQQRRSSGRRAANGRS